ncbi:cDNA sequence BC049715, isoform CRA_a [Mus musculus]|nr:cDNA sequence BC049715, isoform CRA_a [Mus musculus]EDL10571.1 cDNA sequence BC049715, isoform CRA_a [Mus musculus]
MSSESEKDKERLIQAAKLFFFHIRDLVSFINRFVELFNLTMKTQILPMNLNEESCIKDFFEQMIRNFKEMQLMVDGKHKQMQKEPLCSKVLPAVISAVEKCATIAPHHTAEDMLGNIQTSGAALVLKTSHVLVNLETSLSLLTQFPIMGLRLSDLYREETKEQSDATSDATTSEKNKSPECPKATTEETLRKLQDVLSPENAHTPVEAAADELEQFVKSMEITLQVLQKSIKTMEGDISVLTQVQGK